jgi:hypothetical protein
VPFGFCHLNVGVEPAGGRSEWSRGHSPHKSLDKRVKIQVIFSKIKPSLCRLDGITKEN